MSKCKIITDLYESQVLKNNPLGDAYLRQICTYLPPGYEESQQKYPVVFLLSGYSSSGYMSLYKTPFSESLDQRLDRLINTQKIQPMIVVMPDCFTYYGGSQYLDSAATGQYETYLIQELIAYTKIKFRTSTDHKQWAVIGKSSGGYGAMVLAMRHPNVFGITACLSGDMGFEYCYLPDFPGAMLQLERNGGVNEFMKKFYDMPKKDHLSFQTANVIAMAASYSANLAIKPHFIDFPFNLKTGELRQEIWEKWLASDPVRMANGYAENLRELKIFFDCGTRDEYRLYAGARMFAHKLQELNIKHTYEEFEDNHSGLSYRYDVALKFISDNINN